MKRASHVEHDTRVAAVSETAACATKPVPRETRDSRQSPGRAR